jgi:hypothetical protein
MTSEVAWEMMNFKNPSSTGEESERAAAAKFALERIPTSASLSL